MPEIRVDVTTDLDARTLRRTTKDLQQQLDRSAQQAADSYRRNVTDAQLRGNRSVASELAGFRQQDMRDIRVVASVEQHRLSDQLDGVSQLGKAREREHAAELRRIAAESRAAAREERARITFAQRQSDRAERRARKDRDHDLLGMGVKGLRGAEALVGIGSKSASSAAQIGSAGASVAGSLGQVAASGRGLGMALLLGAAPAIAGGLYTIGAAAATASQSLLLLPGAAVAAGAAFGSLKIGLSGFADTIKDIRDPEKFAAGLRGLSGEAQQSALSIQSLLPQFDALKMRAQDALFANVGPQIEAMAATLGPTIENMVVSINSSFNGMFNGLAERLMTPDMQAAIGNIASNLGTTFEALQPVIADVAAAFTDMASSGSNVLPDIAAAAADLAKNFASFISETSKSGEFEARLREGLTALKDLAGAAMGVGKEMFNLLEIGGPSAVAAIVAGAKVFESVLKGIAMVIETSIALINTLIKAFNKLPGPDIPLIPAAVGSWQGKTGNPYAEGGAGNSAGMPTGIGPAPGQYAPRQLPPTGLGNSVGAGLSGATKGGDGASLPAYVDPARITVPAMAPAGPGNGDPGEVFRAESAVVSARNGLEEARLRLINLQDKGNASQLEVLRAQHDIQERERALQSAEMQLAEARQGAQEKTQKSLEGMSKSMDQIGVALDDDLGVAKGLAGMADNLVRFLGNVAFADMMGRLSAVKQTAMSEQGLSDPGMGLVGMYAPPVTAPRGGDGASQYTPYGMGGYPSAPTGYGGGTSGYPGDAALLANVPAGQYTQGQRGDLTQGLADCSSAVEDLVNIMDGRPTGGASMSTSNAAEWLTARGFRPGMGGPGDMRVGFWDGAGNGGHLAATLPGGTNFDWGTQASAQRRGLGGGGADNPAFTEHYYRPTMPGGGGGPMAGGMPTGLPTPSLGMPTGPTTPGLGMPGAGAAAGMGVPPLPGVGGAAGQTPPLGISPGQGGWQPSGGGFQGMGGLPAAAMSGAAGAAGALAPGAGAGAEMAMKLINRSIGFAGQAAAIGVQGLGETFLPHGSALGDPSNNLLMRVAGGFAGAKPATATTAAKQETPGKQPDPNSAQHGPGSAGPGNNGNPLIGNMYYTGPKDDGQRAANAVNRKVNAYGVGGGR